MLVKKSRMTTKYNTAFIQIFLLRIEFVVLSAFLISCFIYLFFYNKYWYFFNIILQLYPLFLKLCLNIVGCCISFISNSKHVSNCLVLISQLCIYISHLCLWCSSRVACHLLFIIYNNIIITYLQFMHYIS